MTSLETVTHFDTTKHVHFEERRGAEGPYWVCRECLEINREQDARVHDFLLLYLAHSR